MCRDTADGAWASRRFSRPYHARTRFDRPLRHARIPVLRATGHLFLVPAEPLPPAGGLEQLHDLTGRPGVDVCRAAFADLLPQGSPHGPSSRRAAHASVEMPAEKLSHPAGRIGGCLLVVFEPVTKHGPAGLELRVIETVVNVGVDDLLDRHSVGA